MKRCNLCSLLNRPLLAFTTALTVSVSATADDLDIYDAILASQTKPNIVFVLDYSGSMDEDVNNILVTDGSVETKLDILKKAVDSVLQDNAGKINAGIGSIYNYRSSGVKWPVSDLEEDAHNIDSNIPIGTKTVADIISSQLAQRGASSTTATVNGLAEAAAYFRGDPVLHSDWNADEPYNHEPAQWNVANERYEGGQGYAALPSSYTPSNAYEYDSSSGVGKFGWCTDYTGGDQECTGKTTYDCTLYPAETYTYGPSEPSEGNTGSSGGTRDIPERNVCKYEHPDNWITPNYISPITQACQANFIVLISDGQPTNLRHDTTLRNVLKDAGVPAGDASKCEDLSTTVFNGTATPVTQGNCGPELLEYLATNDINPAIPDSSVKTYTVGFSLDGPGKDYLKLLADKGEGEFYEASQPAELTDALSSIIDSILAGSQNFAELSIDIDPNNFGHDNRTYFSLFTPSSKSSWKGNLKGFFVDESGLIDVNGLSATETTDAGLRFADTAQSFWSSVPDGNAVLAGGASESITDPAEAPAVRNIYTNLGGDSTFTPANTGAHLVSSNGLINDGLLGNPGATLRTEALDWLATAPMGDPLHTKPVSVNYGAMKVVYIMTNQGFIHGFNATKPTVPGATPLDVSGGAELFAFMPKELLSNIPELYRPTNTSDHVYGLDGTITRWHNDDNGDGVVNGSDTITLVFGMRRGGTSYYALDVTNPNSPKFKWQISNSDPEFSRLAQTWSRASLISVNNSGSKERMLMFGGGYDAATLDGSTNAKPASGNAIFLVDEDGDLVWTLDETDHSDLMYSVPSDLTVIDTDQNGMADRVYFGDLGGQVWRVDFDDINDNPSLTKFANVANGDHQPLFFAPSVSMNRTYDGSYMAISFGSGDRTQPMLSNTGNALYMLRDTDINTGAPGASFTTIGAADIYDATGNDIGSSDQATSSAAKAAMDAARGWAVFLNPSEKSLSKVVTFEGKFLATTFEPDPNLTSKLTPDACSFNMIGRLYIMNLYDAQPIEIQSDGSEAIAGPDASRRTTELAEKMTIPGSPVIVFPQDSSKVQVVVGKESVASLNKKIRTVFWHAK